ncbi:twin-arginine translocase subunit TatC [Gangjinia marincola]|uniref:Sec-independent protein translocase protein TatC n=1 Tax=Gangjinia marincola TaxID=578463 RepID=A0ABN1MDP2_9FLAO
MSTTSPNEMSFLDHLEVLRWHLIRAVGAIMIAATGAFIAKKFIFDTVLLGPKRADFLTYDLLCRLSNVIGLDDSFCFQDLPFAIQSRTMSGQFSAHIWTSITAGFIIAFPYVLYEVWKFIAPGLYPTERKSARGFIFIASFLFFIGVTFGYYIITPLSINFFGNYQVSDMVLNEFDLSSYVGLVRASVLASGIIFELPIIIYFLTKVGLVTPEDLKKYRKFALVIVLVLAAIITPPDVGTQIVVAIPILVLYEVSIFISKRVVKNERKREAKAKKS